MAEPFHFHVPYQRAGAVAAGIVVVDPATGRVHAGVTEILGDIDLVARPGGDRLYLPSDLLGIAVYNTSTLRPVTPRVLIEFAPATAPQRAATAGLQGPLFVSLFPNVVADVDTEACRLRRILPTSSGNQWVEPATDSEGKQLYLGSMRPKSNRRTAPPQVLVKDVADPDGQGTILDIASPTASAHRVRVLLSPDGATLYAYTPGVNAAPVAIDTATLEITARGPTPFPTGLVVDSAGGRLYAVFADRQGVILDAESLKVVGELPCGPDPEPCLAVGGDGRLLVATSRMICTVITPDTGEATATGWLPAKPRAACGGRAHPGRPAATAPLYGHPQT
ncbi:YncE family protein [Embleya sp. NPDC001921]